MDKLKSTVIPGKKVEVEGKKVTLKQALAQKLYEVAMNGDVNALKYVYDRIDGKPRETISHEGLTAADIEIPKELYPILKQKMVQKY